MAGCSRALWLCAAALLALGAAAALPARRGESPRAPSTSPRFAQVEPDAAADSQAATAASAASPAPAAASASASASASGAAQSPPAGADTEKRPGLMPELPQKPRDPSELSDAERASKIRAMMEPYDKGVGDFDHKTAANMLLSSHLDEAYLSDPNSMPAKVADPDYVPLPYFYVDHPYTPAYRSTYYLFPWRHKPFAKFASTHQFPLGAHAIFPWSRKAYPPPRSVPGRQPDHLRSAQEEARLPREWWLTSAKALPSAGPALGVTASEGAPLGPGAPFPLLSAYPQAAFAFAPVTGQFGYFGIGGGYTYGDYNDV